METDLLQWQEQLQQGSGRSRNRPIAVAGAEAGAQEQQKQACCSGRRSSKGPLAAGACLLRWQEQQQGSRSSRISSVAVAGASAGLGAAETASGSIARAFCGSRSDGNSVWEHCRSVLWLQQLHKQQPAPASFLPNSTFVQTRNQVPTLQNRKRKGLSNLELFI